MRLRPTLTALVLTGLAAGGAWAAPRSAGIADPDTKAWWQIAEALSSDAMEGRDTGSAGYDRAADFVVQKFKAAGLKPAGDKGSWFQVFPVHEVSVGKVGTWLSWFPNTADVGIAVGFLNEITVRPTDALPSRVKGPLTFRGYCAPSDLKDARGKVVLCFNTKRAGLPTAAQRIAAADTAGAAALIQVDDPYFTVEPPRWPAAYARSVTIASAPPPSAPTLPVMTMSAPAFVKLAKDAGQDGLSAHLDGYGYGEPVNGDGLYNGALDDAAYVGTLIRFADKHKSAPLRRSVVFAAFTGEEKGLLGAHWFVDHPTVPKASIVADINLDQLRPLFPLDILTELAVDDSTLGRTAREVAATMAIRIQPDPEPERGLLQRADHWPFIQAGVPATGFIFGYVPGTEAERRYREWYQVRYHRPQDDLTQPMDFKAAGKFNRFFYKLAETVADADERPAWTPAR